MRIQPFIIALALAGCTTEPELDTEDLETGQIESESSVYQWGYPFSVPNQKSEWQVGLASYGGRLQMVHNGHSSPNELWQSSFNGSSWTTNVKLTQRSTGGPSLVVHGGQLKMIYRGAGENRLLMSTFNGSTYGTPVTIGSALGYEVIEKEPAATVFNGQIYVGYCTNQKLRIDRFNGSTWTLVHQLPYDNCEEIELAVISGYLTAVYSLSYGYPWSSHYMYENRTADGTNWLGQVYIDAKKTLQPISIVTCNGITHMTHGGFSGPSEIWWSERVGSAWGYDYQVPSNYSYGGAALGCLGTRTFMVHNSQTNDLKYLEFGL